MHANDGRDPSGSKRQRYAAIGTGTIGSDPFATGTIGSDPFAALFATPGLRGVPLIVESPLRDHRVDLATLRQLRAAAPGGGRASRRPLIRL